MKIEHRVGDPTTLTLLEENARYMRHETFQMLVRNIQRDGVLQQWPFVYHDQDTGTRTVLSGNHRVKAAIEAGLPEIDWVETDTPLSEDRQKQIQLAHNAIVGEDDPEILKRIYESITDVEERMTSGLDDETLDLLIQADTMPLSEVNLDFMTITLVFLPNEYDRVRTAFEEARRLSPAKEHWLARNDQYDNTLAAIEDARDAAHIINVAAALDVLLDVWDTHRDTLQDRWLDEEGELKLNAKHRVPTSSILGLNITAEDGRALTLAIRRAQRQHKDAETPVQALIAALDAATPPAK